MTPPPSQQPPPSQPPGQPRRQPSVAPTSLATLFASALATAALGWLAIARFYTDIPTMPWLPPLTLAGLGVIEAITAVSTKARIDRKKGTVPINPLQVARVVMLAKASALAGSLFVGLYAGVLAWLVSDRAQNANFEEDLPQTIAGLLGAVALVVAALWLERSCRVPPPPEADEGRSAGDRSGGGGRPVD